MSIDIVAMQRTMRDQGRVFEFSRGLGIFDNAALLEVDRLNFDELCMAPRFWDAVRGRSDRAPVRWAEVRTALFAATRRFNQPDQLLALYDAMRSAARAEAGDAIDLTIFAERVTCEPLLNLVLGGMSDRDFGIVRDDQRAKIANVLYRPEVLRRGLEKPFPKLKTLADALKECRAGRVVARHLAKRTSGSYPAQDDYAQAVLTLVDRLGISRATYVMTTILTAIAGAPGTVAACMVYELARNDEWRARVQDELRSRDLHALCADPTRTAPVAYAVIREAMRLWSFPLLVARPVMKPLAPGSTRALETGEQYFLSAFLMHRDEEHWSDPERFDPNRWLCAGETAKKTTFAPFGWGPRTCVGATLGLAQYFLFLRLLLIDSDCQVPDPSAAYMGLDGIAAPERLRGTVVVKGNATAIH